MPRHPLRRDKPLGIHLGHSCRVVAEREGRDIVAHRLAWRDQGDGSIRRAIHTDQFAGLLVLPGRVAVKNGATVVAPPSNRTSTIVEMTGENPVLRSSPMG